MSYLFELASVISHGGANIMLDAGIKAAVVLFVTGVAVRFLSRTSAAIRHRVWSLGLCAALLMPILSLTMPQMRVAVLPAATIAKQAESGQGTSASGIESAVPGDINQLHAPGIDDSENVALRDRAEAQPGPFNERIASPSETSLETFPHIAADRIADPSASTESVTGADFRVYLFGIWTAGLVIMLIPLVAGLGMNWMLRRTARRLKNRRWDRLVAELSARIGLTRVVAAFESPQPVVPMTWGFLHPAVLVPTTWRDWTEERKRCVLLHELAHVKRLDVVFQIIGRLAVGFHWFNPLAWYALRQLRIERELACDDCVLASGERASDYARELLQIAKAYRPQRLAMGVAMAQSARLDQRVLGILDDARSRLPVSPKLARCLIAVSTVLVLAVAATSLVERSATAAVTQNPSGQSPQQSDENSRNVNSTVSSDKVTVTAPAEPPTKETPAIEAGQTIDVGDLKLPVKETVAPAKDTNNNETNKAENTNRSAEPGSQQTKPVTVQGRVLDADGKPVAGAKIHIAPEFPGLDPESKLGPPPVATSDESGAFQFIPVGDQLDRSNLQVFVTADGHGPEWLPLADAIERGKIDVSLAKDAPINGRILTLEGQPVVGAKISVESIRAMRNGDLSLYIEAVRAGNGSNFRFDKYLSQPFNTASITTDVEGRFRLSGVGQHRLVELEVVGRAIQHATLRVMTLDSQPIRARAGRRFAEMEAEMGTPPVYGASFEWLARPSRPIIGKVVDSETGQPLKGVLVGAVSEAHDTTDANGRFELIGCAKAKNYGLLVSSQDQPYILGSKSISDTPGLEPLEVTLELTRGIVFTGRVTDHTTGNPVAARVVYYPLHPNTNVMSGIGGSEASASISFCERQTNKDGEFSIAVLPGPGFLGVIAQDRDKYQSADVDAAEFYKKKNTPYGMEMRGLNRSLLLTADSAGGTSLMPQFNFQAIELLNLPTGKEDPIRRDIQLRAAHQVTGVVLAPDGKPVEGTNAYGLADVHLFSSTVVSGSQFVVTALGDDEKRPLLFRHETRRLVGIAEVTANMPQPIRITLQPWGEVSGRLIDTDGQPLANLEIGTVELATEGEILGNLPRLRATDDKGRFHIDGLVPGLTYKIRSTEREEPNLRIVVKAGEQLDVGDVSDIYDSATRSALNPKESKSK